MALYHKLGLEEHKLVELFLNKNKNKKIIIFDVGCNRGLFSDLFINTENVLVHCFEPIENLFNGLIEKYKNNQRFILNKVCISNKNGNSNFYRLLSLETDGCSSLIERPVFKERGWDYVKHNVKTITIDKYSDKNKIKYIDFIKIDVEGAEYLVFSGMSNMLKNKKIGIIQFEYGNTFKDANFSLYMVYDLLKKYGYNLYVFKNNDFKLITYNSINDIINVDNINLIFKHD